jgi:hypothetical protein
MWQGLPQTFGKDSSMKRIKKEAPQTRFHPSKWPLVIVAITVSCVAQFFAQTATAQQPVLVQDAVGNGELATPLPPPEPLPPGTPQQLLGLAELEHMTLSARALTCFKPNLKSKVRRFWPTMPPIVTTPPSTIFAPWWGII